MSPETLALDPRWKLVQEVVQSALFEKSPRLRSFLLYVAEMELNGQRSEINEQHIGIHVFGRSSTYNPGEDSIVRSQARLLRQRLHEYFTTAGTHSELVIDIPKGSYVPVFESRQLAQLPPAVVAHEELASIPVPAVEHNRPYFLIAASFLLLLALIALGLWRHTRQHDPSDRFWSSLFDSHRTQLIVPADSTLILMEELTNREVSFTDYINRQYLVTADLQKAAPNLVGKDLENSHYTSMADLRMVAMLSQLPHVARSHTQVRYARELSMSDAREDNLILIGGARANPWVTLFAGQTNFSVNFDPTTRENRVVNRAPRAGERAFYSENATNTDRSEYGLIAYIPSLDHQGHVLMVSGTSSAGTQSAADFLLNHEQFNSYLQKIQRPDGSIPHFELLLECHSLNGNAAQTSVLTSRLLP